MTEEGKQDPIFTETVTGAFGEISLAIRESLFRDYVSGFITEVRGLVVKERRKSPC